MDIFLVQIRKIFFDVEYQTFWFACSAIGTIVMTFATFCSLFAYRNKEKRMIHNELAELILFPMLNDIDEIAKNLETLNLPSSIAVSARYRREDSCFWDKIKEKHLYLIHNLGPKIKDRIEDYFSKFKDIILIYNYAIEKLDEIIINNASGTPYDMDNLEAFLRISNPRNVWYRSEVGGKLIEISFYKLLFKNLLFSEYIEEIKKEESLLNTTTRYFEFHRDGYSVKRALDGESAMSQFNRIDQQIKNEINNSEDTKKLVVSFREFYVKTKEFKTFFKKIIRKYPASRN